MANKIIFAIISIFVMITGFAIPMIFAETPPITGFITFNIWEQIDTIKDLAKKTPSKAKSYCDELMISSQKDRCYLTISEATKDIAYCHLINNQKLIDRCFSEIAEYINNSAICMSVSEGNRRDDCYMKLVWQGDYSICNKIINKYFKETCNALAIMANVPDYTNYEVPEPKLKNISSLF